MITRRFLVTTRGKAAHAGLAPEEGISAILEMAHVLEAIVRLDGRERRVVVEAVQGGARPNVIAAECNAWILVEAVTAGAIEAVGAALESIPAVLPGAGIAVQQAASAPSTRHPDGSQVVSSAVDTPRAARSDAFRRRRLVARQDLATDALAVPASGAVGEISDYLAGQQAAMQSLLLELARLETPSTRPDTQRAAFDLLARELALVGHDSTWWPGKRAGGMLHSQPHMRTSGAPVQLLLGHCDTVWPVGTLATMPLQMQDGRLSGPGVFDMKAGLVQAVFALRALHALRLHLPATPVLLVNSDEEIGSSESTRAIERLARIACRAFVMEPALGPSGKLKTARKGVGQLRLKLTAVQAAPNAVAAELARLIRALFDLNDLPGGVGVNVGLVDGGGEAAGMMSAAELVVDVRVPAATAVRRVEDAIYGLSPAVTTVVLETSGRVTRMPLERTARNQGLWRAARRLGDELGLALEEGAAGGGSDGNTTSQFTATLDGLGAVGDGAHALHEHVLVDALPGRAALLALLLLSPLHSESSDL